VLSDEFERDPLRGAFPGDAAPVHDPIGHLAVAQNADVYLVAPASANTVAKLAAGIADGMVTTAFLACSAPRAVAPAMNDRMYEDAATRDNLTTLRGRGVKVIEPDSGPLASRGEHGVGRLPSPERLLAELEALLPGAAGPWDGMRVLVTAGGTREPIDPVRFVGNRSSGRMGFALAERAARRGAEVTLIAANVSLREPPAVLRIDVQTAAELEAAVRERFPTAQVLLMAAAVADFRPVGAAREKLLREESGGMDLRLEPTPDVLATVAAQRDPAQTVIGFAAEHGGDAIARARAKLQRKRLDAIVVNDVSRPEIGFESETNEVVIVEADRAHHVPMASKEEVADAILDRVAALRAPAGQQSKT
jgi:phosphopantothenoylcysteine decarboxylase / phosphopantothenate---cysteine ligase